MKIPILDKINYLFVGIANTCKYYWHKKKRETIKVLNAEQSIEYIIDKRCSVSRYGDGELDMIFNLLDSRDTRKSGFQKFNESLAIRLKNILSSGNNDFNHMTGLPSTMFGGGTGYLTRNAAWFWQKYTNDNLDRLISIIQPDKCFLNSTLTRFYLSHKDKSNCMSYLDTVKKIWAGRDILIIEGEKTRTGIGNDLYSGAKSIKRILAPSTDAWGKYDTILSSTADYLGANGTDNTLILCALGMTATVLAFDLARLGWQAIDLGHIDIEYEWMKMGATTKIAVPGKYTNESAKKAVVCENIDPLYLSQIVARIK